MRIGTKERLILPDLGTRSVSLHRDTYFRIGIGVLSTHKGEDPH